MTMPTTRINSSENIMPEYNLIPDLNKLKAEELQDLSSKDIPRIISSLDDNTATEILSRMNNVSPRGPNNSLKIERDQEKLITLFNKNKSKFSDDIKTILTGGNCKPGTVIALKTILVATFRSKKMLVSPKEYRDVQHLLNSTGDTKYEKAILHKYIQSQNKDIDPILYSLIYEIRYECFTYKEEALRQRWRLFGMLNLDNGFTIAGDHVDIATEIIESTANIIDSLENYLKELKEPTDWDQDNRVETIKANKEEFNQVLMSIALLREGRLSNRINRKITEFTTQWIELNKPKPREGLENLPEKLKIIVENAIASSEQKLSSAKLFKHRRNSGGGGGGLKRSTMLDSIMRK